MQILEEIDVIKNLHIIFSSHVHTACIKWPDESLAVINNWELAHTSANEINYNLKMLSSFY
jgi:hypothetical protein